MVNSINFYSDIKVKGGKDIKLVSGSSEMSVKGLYDQIDGIAEMVGDIDSVMDIIISGSSN